MLIQICKNGIGGPRVLALAPDTPGLPSLDATADGGELAFMREELTGIHVDALIGTVPMTGKGSLADALRDGNYSILHLITHGDCEFARLTRESISWQDLSRLLSQHQVKLVLALTCNSRAYADGLIAAGTPQVVCTMGAIENEDARVLAREFYGALVRDLRPAEAVAFAKSRMSADGAGLVLLLPDEEQQPIADPVLAQLDHMERELEMWRSEVRHWFTDIDGKLNGCSTRQDDMMRSLTAAVVHLTEVLSR